MQDAAAHRIVFKTRTRVRFAETDAAGIVYYGNFFVYFELGRIEMFRDLGLPYDRTTPIAETHARFHAPAFFDDPIEIHSIVEEVRRAGFRIASRVYRAPRDEEPVLLAEGFTSMVHVGEDRRPRDLPRATREALERARRAPSPPTLCCVFSTR